jgi:diguanylate cyclase (GGDEF)-like protein
MGPRFLYVTRLWHLPLTNPLAAWAMGRWPAAARASAASDHGDSALRRLLGWATPVAAAAMATLAAAAGGAFAHRPSAFGALVLVVIVATAVLLSRGFATRILGRLDGEVGEREALRSALVAAHRTREELRTLAYHDNLTGLPNRSLLHDRLGVAITHARRQGTRLAVLFLDLDDFKTLNDSCGHAFGDRLLVELAVRVRASVRAGDTVARFGGDEFVVLLDEVNGTADAAHVATKVLEALRAPFRLDGQQVTVAASVGMSLFPDDGVSCDELLRQADVAMYREKQTRRGGAWPRLRQSERSAAKTTRREVSCEEADVLDLGPRPHADCRAAQGLPALRPAGEAVPLRSGARLGRAVRHRSTLKTRDC